MNINQYRQQAAHYRQLLQEQEDLRIDIAKFEKDFKESANLTNPQVATTKRIIKADIKGKLPDLIVKMDDDNAILDILAPSEEKIIEEKVCDTPHDPETGEILAIEHQETELVAGAVKTGTAETPSGESEARDSAPINSDDLSEGGLDDGETPSRSAPETVECNGGEREHPQSALTQPVTPTTPNDILGENPIPDFLDRRAG